jgi:hypothetical protein
MLLRGFSIAFSTKTSSKPWTKTRYFRVLLNITLIKQFIIKKDGKITFEFATRKTLGS